MTDPTRWLSTHIPEWAELQRHEKRTIRDFPILWALFELHATGQNRRRPDATPTRICSAVEQLVEDPPMGGEIIGARAHFANRYFAGGLRTYRWQHLGVNTRFQAQVTHGLLDEIADNRQVFTALLLVVNRLRNNFLHGEKARYGFRNQYENFRHANNVLVAAVELWPRHY